jgi:hypothetical protein
MGVSSNGKSARIVKHELLRRILDSHRRTTSYDIDPQFSEQSCSALLDQPGVVEIPEACKQYASVKTKLEAKMASDDPFAGMTPGAQRAVRNAQIKRRMSTRHGQGAQGKKASWF